MIFNDAKAYKILFIIFFNFFLNISSQNLARSQTKITDQFYKISSECIIHSDFKTCKNALLQAELLKRMAAFDEEYRCESLLLGLESDLIMSQMNKSRRYKAIASIGQIRKTCKDF
tara:strand:- start:51 stop:398 length:348 start_codon:yes stop_codon:yes gene_type:complete